MNRRSGVVHAIGECKDCGATFDNYKNAMALSAQHARRYGHTVHVEQCITVMYEGGG
jgi:hypothetical protein